jgi:hypothetical protein
MKIMSERSKRIEPKLSLPERIAKRWSIGSVIVGGHLEVVVPF